MTMPLLRVQNLTKRFPGVLANDRVNFELYPQEIHALLGENGAGKSTLMNVIFGLYHPDEGEIFINGQPVRFQNPNDALSHGIGMVHQHFMLVPVMTVTENLMLGHELVRGPRLGKLSRLDRKAVARQIRELGERYGLQVNPDAYVSDLSVGEAQRVEILKALYRGAEILILDEPTAVLTPQETDDLFAVIRLLVEQGKSVIFITHKLQEVLAVADRITVLRDGRNVGTCLPSETSREDLAARMVGREVLLRVDKTPAQPGPEVLEVRDLQVKNAHGHQALKGVSLSVHAGEILGIAGVQGNGQTELAQALSGLTHVEAGEISIAGQKLTGTRPRHFTEAGLAHVPEDRHKHGLVLNFSISENLILQTYYQEPFTHGLSMDAQAMDKNGADLVQQYDIRAPSPKTPVSNLSGGNQQKVIVARELSRPIRVLLINQPTRGLDVGSIEYIHRRIIEVRDSGVAILLISAELEEILALSDRIAVLYNGEIRATLPAAQADRRTLGLLMAGVQLPADPL